MGGLFERPRRVAVLSREHQLEERRIAGGEAHIRGGGRPDALLEVIPRAVGRRAQLRAESLEARLGKRVQQRLAIGEVPAGGAVADAHRTREPAQGKLLDATLAHRPLGLPEQRRAQVAVVVGGAQTSPSSLPHKVVVDIIVVIDYIVAHDYFEQHPTT